MKKMVNELEEKEFPYYPSKNFTLKGSKNQFPSLQINKYNNLSEMNNNKVSFQNIHSYIIKNNVKMNLNNYKKINKKQKLINNNKPNNIHIFSTINDYWEKREKENKIKMDIIKRERDEKKYGDIYPKPKINKNTEAIINRIKENINNKILEEEQIEDQINRNIPIRTEKRSTYFKNNYKTCKNKNYM